MYSPPDPPNLISGLVRTLRGSELTSKVDPVPKPLCQKIGIWSPKRVFLKLIQLYLYFLRGAVAVIVLWLVPFVVAEITQVRILVTALTFSHLFDDLENIF